MLGSKDAEYEREVLRWKYICRFNQGARGMCNGMGSLCVKERGGEEGETSPQCGLHKVA